jgi:P27 family predicted phage terminase small subunit
MATKDELIARFRDKPIRELGDRAKAIWAGMLPLVVSSVSLRPEDLYTFADYCEQAELVEMIKRDLDVNGLMIATPHGLKLNPLVGARDKAIGTMLRIADRLGISPKGRAKLKGEADVKGDEFDEFLQEAE